MSWIRRASIMTALAALTMGGACAKGKDTPPAQPVSGAAAPTPPAAAAEEAPAAAAASAASSPAPAATVRDAGGQTVALASAWQSGPAVLVFYRGHW